MLSEVLKVCVLQKFLCRHGVCVECFTNGICGLLQLGAIFIHFWMDSNWGYICIRVRSFPISIWYEKLLKSHSKTCSSSIKTPSEYEIQRTWWIYTLYVYVFTKRAGKRLRDANSRINAKPEKMPKCQNPRLSFWCWFHIRSYGQDRLNETHSRRTKSGR